MALARQILALVVSVLSAAGAIAAVREFGTGPAWGNLAAQILIGLVVLGYILSQPHVQRWLSRISVEQWRAIDAETEPAGGA